MNIKKLVCALLAAVLIFTVCGCGAQESFTQPQTNNQGATEEGKNPTQSSGQTSTQDTTEAATEPEDVIIPPNPYGPLDFAYEGEFLVCLEGESMVGVDVSAWQGDIDWQQVAQAGVEFAIIRMAWRGTEQGDLYADEYAERNYYGATEAGIQVGGYVFSQAICAEEAVEEAQFMLDMCKDWDIQMPLIFDWEYIDSEARTANVDARTLTDASKAFCDTINAAGYESMVYFNPEQSWRKLFLEELIGYEFWLAMYDTTMLYPYKIHMWQYTATGAVPGIEGPVDLNVYLQYEKGE